MVEEKKGGIDDNTLAFVAYVLTWLSGLVVFLIAKDKAKNQKFVRFHAMQAILLGAAVFVAALVLGFIPILGWVMIPFVALGVWLYALYIGFTYAYKGQIYKVPYLGEYAEKYSE
ncbi:MAG: hypothetical protein QXT45_01460 [Candidatus Bilamarchaeaceae archaeon]